LEWVRLEYSACVDKNLFENSNLVLARQKKKSLQKQSHYNQLVTSAMKRGRGSSPQINTQATEPVKIKVALFGM